MLAAERRDLERRRQQLFLDRLAFKKRVRQVEDELANKMAALNARDSANSTGKLNDTIVSDVAGTGGGAGVGAIESIMGGVDGTNGGFGGAHINGSAGVEAPPPIVASDPATEEKLIAVPTTSEFSVDKNAIAVPAGTDLPGYTSFEI